MTPERVQACLLVCQECGREGVDDVASGLCEACIGRHEDRTVRAMSRAATNMRRWQKL